MKFVFTETGLDATYYESSFSLTSESTQLVKLDVRLEWTNDPIQFNVEIDNLPLNEYVLPEGSRNSR